MTAYNSETSGESKEIVNQNIADVIAYLKEMALKFEEKENARIKQEVGRKNTLKLRKVLKKLL